MKQFRISENVPDVYPRKSRDFQLFCAIFDCLFGELKYNIDSIIDITNTSQCNERLLPLLQTKLGFFTKEKISGEDLRLILRAFPTIVRNKGSKTGIIQAVQVYLKLFGLDVDSEVTITNKVFTEGKYDDEKSYIVDIAVSDKLTDTSILTEILKYVIPAGYKLRYSYKSKGKRETIITATDRIEIVYGDSPVIDPITKGIDKGTQSITSGLRPDNNSDNEYSDMLGRVDTSFVVNEKQDIVELNEISSTSTSDKDKVVTVTRTVIKKG